MLLVNILLLFFAWLFSFTFCYRLYRQLLLLSLSTTIAIAFIDNYCYRLFRQLLLSPLSTTIAIAFIDNYCNYNSWKSYNYTTERITEKKPWINARNRYKKMKKRGKEQQLLLLETVITKGETRQKSLILLFRILGAPIIFCLTVS